MTRIKYSYDIMKYMSTFESLTGAKLKDCIADDNIIFIVQENDMGRAIGKNGSNIKRVESLLKKKIKLIEFSNDVARFVGNLINPLRVKEIREEDGVVNIYAEDTKTKGMLIGREKQRINSINDIVKRYFQVKEVKVA